MTEIQTLHSQRDLFDLPDDIIFLNCANMSPQLRQVTRAGLEAVRQKQSSWEIRAVDWFSGAEALRQAAAALMNAETDHVALVP